jgi:uncharacterized protein (DUF433 family)
MLDCLLPCKSLLRCSQASWRPKGASALGLHLVKRQGPVKQQAATSSGPIVSPTASLLFTTIYKRRRADIPAADMEPFEEGGCAQALHNGRKLRDRTSGGRNNMNAYVESRDGGSYVAGSRVSLASLVHAFRQGASPETILQDFPHIGSLAKVYGAIAFILENPTTIVSYLAEQERLWNELEQEHPLPPDMKARFEEGRELLKRQLA